MRVSRPIRIALSDTSTMPTASENVPSSNRICATWIRPLLDVATASTVRGPERKSETTCSRPTCSATTESASTTPPTIGA